MHLILTPSLIYLCCNSERKPQLNKIIILLFSLVVTWLLLLPLPVTSVSFLIFIFPSPITVRDIGIAYSRMLLHDKMLKEDSFRSGTSDTAFCGCAKADESVEHFLLDCENYAEARKVMMDTIGDLLLVTKLTRSLRITESLLLAPTSDDNVGKRVMSFVKEALFEFISSCNRNI